MLWKLFKRDSPSKVKPTKSAVAQRLQQRRTDVASANLGSSTQATKPEEPSFDPYNSGAFDKRNTWDKVVRK